MGANGSEASKANTYHDLTAVRAYSRHLLLALGYCGYGNQNRKRIILRARSSWLILLVGCARLDKVSFMTCALALGNKAALGKTK